MEILKVSYQPWVQAGLEQEGQQQQNKREQEVQLYGSAAWVEATQQQYVCWYGARMGLCIGATR
jgi:hypothetical protein